MPFKSKSQYRKFKELLADGKISQSMFDHWKDSTPSISNLPEKVASYNTDVGNNMNYDEIYENAFNDELEKVAGIGSSIKGLGKYIPRPVKSGATSLSSFLLRHPIGVSLAAMFAPGTTYTIGNALGSTLGVEGEGEDLAERFIALKKENRDKFFTVRHPYISGLTTDGIWPAIDNYRILRQARKELKNKEI